VALGKQNMILYLSGSHYMAPCGIRVTCGFFIFGQAQVGTLLNRTFLHVTIIRSPVCYETRMLPSSFGTRKCFRSDVGFSSLPDPFFVMPLLCVKCLTLLSCPAVTTSRAHKSELISVASNAGNLLCTAEGCLGESGTRRCRAAVTAAHADETAASRCSAAISANFYCLCGDRLI
jgi:hypothetical protein